MAEEATPTAEERVGGIRIGDKLYESPDDFTIGEAETIKQITELTPQELLTAIQADPTDPLCLRAVAWVVLHREDAKVEPDDARITDAFIGAFFEIPEVEAGDPPASRRKRSSSGRRTT